MNIIKMASLFTEEFHEDLNLFIFIIIIIILVKRNM